MSLLSSLLVGFGRMLWWCWNVVSVCIVIILCMGSVLIVLVCCLVLIIGLVI